MSGKLPFLSKKFTELGLVGRVAYLASAVTAVVAAGVSIWQAFVFFGDRMDEADRTALLQYESVLRIELHVSDDEVRQTEIYKELERIDERLD